MQEHNATALEDAKLYRQIRKCKCNGRVEVKRTAVKLQSRDRMVIRRERGGVVAVVATVVVVMVAVAVAVAAAAAAAAVG